MTGTVILLIGCAVILATLGYLIWRGDQQINQAEWNVFGTTDPPDTAVAGHSNVVILDEYEEARQREIDNRGGGGAAS